MVCRVLTDTYVLCVGLVWEGTRMLNTTCWRGSNLQFAHVVTYFLSTVLRNWLLYRTNNHTIGTELFIR